MFWHGVEREERTGQHQQMEIFWGCFIGKLLDNCLHILLALNVLWKSEREKNSDLGEAAQVWQEDRARQGRGDEMIILDFFIFEMIKNS